ncbi:MAG: 2-dehydropantoate 2-reductase [Gammaproteobacteria bacterium]|nr:2-dehydropantoate 2-reductase [Gammaproteobacteria bacterium]
MNRAKRIAVIGAGAIGGNVGGTLAHHGFDVTLIDQWPEHIEAIKRNGLIVKRIDDELRTRPQALHIHELQGVNAPFDHVFVSVKAYDTRWACMLMLPYLADGGTFVDFQNGINDETVAEVVGRERTLGAVVTIGAGCYEAGTVLRTDNNPYGFKIGELDGQDTPRARELAEIVNHVAKTVVTTNLWGERWSKLMINCMNNGVAGLTGWGTTEVRTLDAPRRVGIQLGAETVSVAKALGFKLEPVMNVDPEALVDAARGIGLAEVDAAIIEAGKLSVGGRPSLLQDTMKGRRTEIEHLNGLVSEKGREVGVATPFNDKIVEVVKALPVGFTPVPENLDPLVKMLP